MILFHCAFTRKWRVKKTGNVKMSPKREDKMRVCVCVCVGFEPDIYVDATELSRADVTWNDRDIAGRIEKKCRDLCEEPCSSYNWTLGNVETRADIKI